MPRPTVTKIIPLGTLGSHTTLRERLRPWAPLYHGGQVFPWAVQHRRTVGWFLVFVVWWVITGGIVLALVGLALSWVGLTAGLFWRRSRTEGSAYSLSDYRAERQHRATLNAERWAKACRRWHLVDQDTKEPPKLRKMRTLPGGSIQATVVPAEAVVPEADFLARSADFASVFRCGGGVRIDQVTAGELLFTFHWKDQMSRVLPLAELPVPPRGRNCYGIQENGQPATLPLNLSVLAVGMTGSGKSSLWQTLIADHLAQQIPTWLYISDTKEQEFREYIKHVGVQNGNLTVKVYQSDVGPSEKMIGQVLKNMAVRSQALDGRDWQPSTENPKVIVILDEMLDLTDTVKKGSASDLAQIIRKGRTKGYVVYAGTQMAQMSAMSNLRELFPLRICFAVRTRQATEMALGTDAVNAGAMSHTIRNQPGVGYAFAEDAHKVWRVRVAYVNDSDLRDIAGGTTPAALMRNRATAIGEVAGPHFTYEFYDVSGRCLYVGETNDTERRFGEHARDKAWWHQVDQTKTVITPYESRKLGEAAEGPLIRELKPVYNDKHNRSNPNRVRRFARRVDQRTAYVLSSPRGRREADARRKDGDAA